MDDPPAGASPRGAWVLLAGLTALNVLGYVDRQLVATLAPLLIDDLGLTRADIGLLLGVAFIPVYAVGTLVVGVLADRVSRPRLIAGGLGLWSAATGLTGTASGFPSLLAWRGLVGVGEATLPPTALAMLGDRFPSSRLGFAAGVYYAGIPVGFALSFALSGWLGPWLGWRACFVAVGLVGIAAVLAVARMADPPRLGQASRAGGATGPAPRRSLKETARTVLLALRERPAIPLLVLGATLLAFTSSASQHGITWLVAERGFAYARAAWLSALFVGTAGLAGNLGLGWLTDRARRRHPAGRLASFAVLGVFGLGAGAVFYSVSPDSPLFLPAWFLSAAWTLGWFGPALAAVDEEAPPGLRATVLGVALLTLNLVGVAGGPWVTGILGDRVSLTFGLLVSVGVGAAGVGLVALAAVGQYRRDASC